MTLRELRFLYNLTQEELSVITKVTQQHISRVESGKMRMSQAFAEKLQEHFNLALDVVWEMMKHSPPVYDRRERRGPYVGAGTKK